MIEAAIADDEPDVIGLSAVSTQVASARELSDRARRLLPGAVQVLGGVHGTVDPENALARLPEIEVLVRGEGEEAFVALLAALRAGRAPVHATWAVIPGLSWRGPGGVIASSAASGTPPAIDAIPLPLREGLLWPDEVQPSLWQGMLASRGCPYRCTYCAAPVLSGRRVRPRSPQAVVAEMTVLKERFGLGFVFFHDSVFTLHRARSVTLAEAMIASGLGMTYACQTRVDRLDQALVDLLRQAGCVHVMLGIESGHPESLRRMRKEVSLEQIRDAVAMLKGAGIRSTGFFMIGFPWEGEEHVQATVDVATGVGLDAAQLFAATAFPGTELALQAPLAAGCLDDLDFRQAGDGPAGAGLPADPAGFAKIFEGARERFDDYNRAQLPGPRRL